MSPRRAKLHQLGFTLFEMCIVLLLIALVLGMVTAELDTVLEEQALRVDASHLTFCIRSAMARAQDENRVYVVRLTPLGVSMAVATGHDDGPLENPLESDAFESVDQIWKAQNNRLEPWVLVKEETWRFTPGELCPIKGDLRWTRHSSYINLRFDPLTAEAEETENSFK
jgi:type II secretory pathway pseudopilin PulG